VAPDYQVTTSTDESGNTIVNTTLSGYATQNGINTQWYSYDKMNRLSSVATGGYGEFQTGTTEVQTGTTESGTPVYTTVPLYTQKALGKSSAIVLDTRLYDADSRELESGPEGSLPAAYVAALVGSDTNLSGATTTISQYNANGELLNQDVVNEANSTGDYDMAYTGYDAAGNVTSEQMTQGDIRSNYTYHEVLYEGYKEGSVVGVDTNTASGNQTNGTTTESYDVNGNLIGVTDSANGADDRSFINDVNGTALQKTQDGNVYNQLVVNGNVVGNYGVAQSQDVPTDSSGNPNFVGMYDFDEAYQPVTNSYPAAATGQYPVQSGDTLQSIALAAYGDSSLWYEIADANGLSGNADLKVGAVLTIPTKVGATHNTASTYAPYDASKVVGSTKPNLPTPAGLPPSQSSGGGGCGGLGTIIMVVVAVVATVVTAGAALAALGPVLAGALGGVVGSIASQAVGNAIGAEDGFSWSQVATAAIGGAISGGVGDATGATEEAANGISPTLGESVGRAALSNIATQGVDVTVGLQKSFSWQSVAGAAVGAGVSSGVGSELSGSFGNDAMGTFETTAVSTFAGGVTQSLVSGGRVNVAQVAADAFGNALGSSLVSYMQAPSPVPASAPSQYSLASGTGDGTGFTSGGGQGFTSGGQDNPLGQNLANDTPQFTMGQSAPSYSLSSGNGTGQGLSLNGGGEPELPRGVGAG